MRRNVVVELAVLEARWYENGNHSVQPLFDTLAGMHHDNPFAYRYEMFCDADSFARQVEALGKTRGFVIFISLHMELRAAVNSLAHGYGIRRQSASIMQGSHAL